MKYLYRSLIVVALTSMSATIMADSNSPELMASLPKGSLHKISYENAKDLRGGYRRCHNL